MPTTVKRTLRGIKERGAGPSRAIQQTVPRETPAPAMQ